MEQLMERFKKIDWDNIGWTVYVGLTGVVLLTVTAMCIGLVATVMVFVAGWWTFAIVPFLFVCYGVGLLMHWFEVLPHE
jgi:hypothetical protein